MNITDLKGKYETIIYNDKVNHIKLLISVNISDDVKTTYNVETTKYIYKFDTFEKALFKFNFKLAVPDK